MISILFHLYYTYLVCVDLLFKKLPLKYGRWFYLKLRKRYIEVILYYNYLGIAQSAPYLALRNLYIDKIKNNENITGFVGKWIVILARKVFLVVEVYPLVYLFDRFFREHSKSSPLYKRIYLRQDYRHYDLFIFLECLVILGGLVSLNIRTIGQYLLVYLEMTFFFVINFFSQLVFGLHIEKVLDNWIGYGLYTKCRSFVLYQELYLDLNVWFTPNAYWLYYSLFAISLLSAIQTITMYEDFAWYMVDNHGFYPTTPYLIFGDTNEDGPLFGVASVVKNFIIAFVFISLVYPQALMFSAVYVMFLIEGLWVGYQSDFPIDEELGGALVKKEQLRDRIFEMMQNSSEFLSGSYRREQLFEYFFKEKSTEVEQAMRNSVEPFMYNVMNFFSNLKAFAYWLRLPELYRRLIPTSKVTGIYYVAHLIEQSLSNKWDSVVSQYTDNNFQAVKEMVSQFYEFVIYRGLLIFDLRIGGEYMQDYEDYFSIHFDRDMLAINEATGVENTFVEEEEHESFFKEVYVTRGAEAEEILNRRAERDRIAVLSEFVPDIGEQVIREKLEKKALFYKSKELQEAAEEKTNEKKKNVLIMSMKDLDLSEEGDVYIEADYNDYSIDLVMDTKSSGSKLKKKIKQLFWHPKKEESVDPFDHQKRIQSQSEEHIDEIDMEFMVEEQLAQQQKMENDLLGHQEEEEILASRQKRMAAIYATKKLSDEWPWLKLKNEFEDEVFDDLFNQSDVPYEIYTKYLRWQIMAPFIFINAWILILLGPESFPLGYTFYDYGCPESIDANRPYSVTEHFWLYDQFWWLGDGAMESYFDPLIPALFNYWLYEIIKMQSLLTEEFDKIELETPNSDEFWKKYYYYKDKLSWKLIKPYVDEYWGYVTLYCAMVVDIIKFVWYNYILWELIETKDFYVEIYVELSKFFKSQ